jgi:uncharacterized paraquat-inducible protein A
MSKLVEMNYTGFSRLAKIENRADLFYNSPELNMNQTPIEQNAAEPAVNEPEYKECFKCSFRGETADAACPKCGKKLRTAKNIRVRGVIQIVTGVVLVALMIGLAVFIGVAVMNAAQDAAQAKRIAGEKTLFIGIYGLFAVLTLFWPERHRNGRMAANIRPAKQGVYLDNDRLAGDHNNGVCFSESCT